MAIITDKEVRAEKQRINKNVEKWRGRLGLNHWKVDAAYTITPIREGDNPSGTHTLATCEAQWEYLQAYLTFYVTSTCELSDDDSERLVIHELLHAVVAETRANWDDGMPFSAKIAHEERLVSELTNAFWFMELELRRLKPKK